MTQNKIIADLSTSERAELQARIQNDIQLLFFDIDGTLLDSSASLPAGVAEQIARVQSLGIKTAVASGRPIFAAESLIQQLSLHDAGLFYTGAALYDPLTQSSLAEHPLAVEDVMNLIPLARQLNLHCELYTLNDYFIEVETIYTPYHSHYLKRAPIVAHFNESLLAQKIFKIQLVVDQNTEMDKLICVQERFPKLCFATGHGADKPEIIFSSVVSPAADKNTAFQTLLDHHQLDAKQVMSFGDAGSDQVFLSLAGIGIAMGNANAEVKRSADFVTSHVDNQGLIQVLELF